MPTSKRRLLLAGLGGIAVAGSAAGGVLLVSSGEAGAASPTVYVAGAVPSVAAEPSTPEAPSSLFRDGDYAATGRYLTPGGNESILVSLRIRGGVVTSVVSRTEATSPTARQFQEQFRVSVAAKVVARPLASVSVGVVAGASLTSSGFNDALGRIRAEAHR